MLTTRRHQLAVDGYAERIEVIGSDEGQLTVDHRQFAVKGVAVACNKQPQGRNTCHQLRPLLKEEGLAESVIGR